MTQQLKRLLASTAACLAVVSVLHAEPPAVTDAESTPVDEAEKIMTVDRENRVIDLKAKMVPAEPQWLELVATTPGPKGREHEAIVTIDIKPSLIHLELIKLGLEPGSPQKNRLVENKILTDPPTGPELVLSFVYEKDGQEVEVPAYDWVLDKETGKPIEPCKWLFTGSDFREWQGREYYMADEAGTIVSLVNFGDDLIVRKTDTTKDTDFQQLQINKEAIPPYGSELTLRIKIPKPTAGSEKENSPESPIEGAQTPLPGADQSPPEVDTPDNPDQTEP